MATNVVQLFQIVQNFYKTIGLNLPTQLSSLNGKQFLFIIIPAPFIISSVAFFLFEAQTADEYGTSFYMSISVLGSAINISNIAWEIDKILTLIGKYEKFIDKS